MGYWTGALSYQRGDGIYGLEHCLTRGVMGYWTGALSYQGGDGI